jgi:hypothetical protein
MLACYTVVTQAIKKKSLCLLAVVIRPTVPSGEPLIRVRGKSSTCRLLLSQADHTVMMRSPCAGAALPPLWIVRHEAFSLSLSLRPYAGPRVPIGGVTLKRCCTYRPSVILIVNKLLSLSLGDFRLWSQMFPDYVGILKALKLG